MTPADARADIERCLDKLGFDFARPSLDIAWRAFADHLAQPVTGADSCGMVEIGTFNHPAPPQPFTPAFLVDLCRQFGFYDKDGEFEGYEQLHLTLYLQPTSKLEQLKANFFLDHDGSREGFLASVEASSVFRSARALTFAHASIDYWEV